MDQKGVVMEINQWVVVCSRAQAKVFRRTDSKRPLQWVYNLVNEEGRLKNREFGTQDRPGLSFASYGGANHPYNKEGDKLSPHERAMEKFAKQICVAIKVGADQHAFNKLYVFAEPHMLGRIKQNVPKSLKNIDIEWIGKDLEKATAEEIQDRVS
jgi:protein required for attachment to host cells